ncbi:hypothetical protein REPUB_Repub03eG0173400 [Reevesia pubescens]
MIPSLSFTHPFLIRHVHSTVLSLSYPLPPTRFSFLSSPSRFVSIFSTPCLNAPPHFLPLQPPLSSKIPPPPPLSLLAPMLSSSLSIGSPKKISFNRELLRGPLYYVLILIVCAVLFWRESPVGIISLAMMCGGDGVADIMGRRFGSSKIPYNQRKSWVGSISMFVLDSSSLWGCCTTTLFLDIFNWIGVGQCIGLL